MAFAPLLVGSLLAILVLALFDRLSYQKYRAAAIRSGSIVLPEKRLYPAMLGSILLPISLFVSIDTSVSSLNQLPIYSTSLCSEEVSSGEKDIPYPTIEL
jgi:hypothetical protein